MTPAADVFPKAFRRVKGKQLLEFARKLHLEMMQRTARQTSSLATLLLVSGVDIDADQTG